MGKAGTDEADALRAFAMTAGLDMLISIGRNDVKRSADDLLTLARQALPPARPVGSTTLDWTLDRVDELTLILSVLEERKETKAATDMRRMLAALNSIVSAMESIGEGI